MSKLAAVVAEVKGQAAHLEARTLLLQLAREFQKDESESNTAQVFAGAVQAYLEAELTEPCLHLHAGTHFPACSEQVCGKVLLEGDPPATCGRTKGHRGAHCL